MAASGNRVGGCCVVSPDERALEIARALGATIVREPGNRGVNAAVLSGVEAARTSDVLVVPADLPLLSSRDIATVADLSEVCDIVLSPSRAFDGTNLLCFSKDRAPQLSYDSDSFWNHLRDSARRRYSLAVYTGPGAVLDVDTPEDLKRLVEMGPRAGSIGFAAKVMRRRAS